MTKSKINLTIKNTLPLRERVYKVIKDLIVNGQFSAGERLVEAHIAEQINTSRTPVREALHILEREGLLESEPRVGYRIKPILWEEVEEICEIRRVNETLAASWAMNRITQQDIEKLQKNITRSQTKINQGETKAFTQLDEEFHDLLINCSGSRKLAELCHMLRIHMLRYRYESLHNSETAVGAVQGHRHILAAIIKKDKEEMVQAIRDHLDFARRTIKSHAVVKKN